MTFAVIHSIFIISTSVKTGLTNIVWYYLRFEKSVHKAMPVLTDTLRECLAPH